MLCCLYIPDFPAQAVIRSEPALRRRAVAVLEGAGDPASPLQRVCGMNEAARQAGIENGMAKLQAETLPEVALRRRSAAQEAAAQAALLDAAHAFSPRVEPLAPDTVLADLSGLERLFGPPPKMAQELARRAAALGLEAHVAVAHNREAAVHAARGLPGVTVIPPGEEGARLGPLPVDVLFAGPDASQLPNGRTAELPNFGLPQPSKDQIKNQKSKIKNRPNRSTDPPISRASKFGSSAIRQFGNPQQFLETLDRWGVHNLRAFAALPTVAVAERLGQEGVRLQKLARGEGSQALAAAEPPLRFEEAIELEHPVEQIEPLAFLLARLLEQLCARLAARALATNELRLALTLDSAAAEESDSPRRREDTKRIRSSVDQFIGSSDPGGRCTDSPMHRSTDPEFGNSAVRQFGSFSRTLCLPVPMLDAKVFLKLLQLDLEQHPPGAPVLGLALAAEPVRPQVAQHGLFQAATPAPEKLQLMLARLAGIVGENNVGSPTPLDTHQRDAFVMRAFTVAEGESRAKGKGQKAKTPRDASESMSRSADSPVSNSAVRQFGNSAISGSASALSGPVAAKLAVRLFRPPLAATVEVKDERPVRLACAGPHGERGAALAGDIVWAAGPWRASGNWWREAVASAECRVPSTECRVPSAEYRAPSTTDHPELAANARNSVLATRDSQLATRYSRDEWDIAVAAAGGVVLCRLVRDRDHDNWFVEGTYD